MRHARRIRALVLGSMLVLPLLATVPAFADRPAGTVYTLSNDASSNAVLVFHRAPDGSLTPSGSDPTGGLGSGDGLGSQGALVLSDDGRWLLGVNAGSDDLSVFAVTRAGIRLTDVQSSGGDRPISVTIHRNLVYALNDGSDTVSGLRLSRSGTLTPIAGSTTGLSGADIAPAQVEFTPNARKVVVTEKNTNLIDVFTVGSDGRLGPPNVQPSEGETPFGFAFDTSGRLIVSEAFGGAAGASTMSSYAVGRDGGLTTISASVPDGESAACWVVVTPDGRFAYTTNTGSDTVSGYTIGADGSLTLFDGAAFASGDGPLDAAIAGGAFLYTVNGGSHDISAYSIGGNGALTAIPGASGLPATTLGLAAK
ncbi:MAG: lactonase family protein [Actinomycetota bacterium]